ncbi:glutathione transferase GST 23-like [Pyrus ussuriensis x Pyrus communis]|uniref:Glutathione transferase GST 23-like n=1 Tax=Pyrus ussuriensis x Pyrus communis TaxID=2448454 RepID=A0A5N5FGZ5_9ROSA|nr:glutathione transferase GST 23-like [Pyrus ussuriensis x Pyrus communis]KAB2612089.1 glutathione transferase GST 23-like [Pyrus ussuriensis x Pyrus communis]
MNLVDITHEWLALWFESVEEMVGVKLLEPSTLPRLHAWVQNFKQVLVIRDNLPNYQKLVAHMKRVREMLVPQV